MLDELQIQLAKLEKKLAKATAKGKTEKVAALQIKLDALTLNETINNLEEPETEDNMKEEIASLAPVIRKKRVLKPAKKVATKSTAAVKRAPAKKVESESVAKRKKVQAEAPASATTLTRTTRGPAPKIRKGVKLTPTLSNLITKVTHASVARALILTGKNDAQVNAGLEKYFDGGGYNTKRLNVMRYEILRAYNAGKLPHVGELTPARLNRISPAKKPYAA
ncbi:MAG: hypothetical protein GY941_19780 [Planctomycetes bacterium]|nr:hypothetical protein [Planctomycetota bacterium]